MQLVIRTRFKLGEQELAYMERLVKLQRKRMRTSAVATATA
jgi:hypothetical protein